MDNNIIGIYRITNKENGKVYIGSSVDIHLRWLQHKSQLKKNKHHSRHLQNAWNKYGEDNFRFDIVELIDDIDLLLSAEQKWINKTKSYDYHYGYNMSIDASRPDIGSACNQMNANIVFRDKIRDICNMQLDKNEKLVYYVLRDFVQHPSNCVMINGEVPKFKELEGLISLTERKIRDCLKSLEVKNLLKLVQSGHRKAIYINPEYYATGKELNITTLALFGLVEIDQEKINGYISPTAK